MTAPAGGTPRGDGRLAEIEARWAAATPGPWRTLKERCDNCGRWHVHGPGMERELGEYGETLSAWPQGVMTCTDGAKADAIAIAAAPQDIAWLMAEVKALRASAQASVVRPAPEGEAGT